MTFTNIDAELVDADWTKGTWDIYDDNGLVTTVAQLRTVFPRSSDSELKAMLKLPSAAGMPIQLKTELTLLKGDQ